MQLKVSGLIYFKVQVNDDYELLGTDKRLSKDKVYEACFAFSSCYASGDIWVEDFLLHEGEYKILDEDYW